MDRTPHFVLDIERLRERIELLADMCREAGGEYAFPLKVNYAPEVLDCVRRTGVALDVCSVEEVALALTAGFAPAAVTCCGAGLDRRELEQLSEAKIRLDLESLDEIRLLADVSPGSDIGLRIAQPSAGSDSWRACYSDKFGVRRTEIEPLRRILDRGGLTVSRLHLHPSPLESTGSDDLEPYLAPFAAMCRPLESVNWGGGWHLDDAEGWPQAAAARIARARAAAEALGADAFVVEPGEAVVAPAGRLLTRIRSVKPPAEGRPRHVIIVDAPYTMAVGSGLVPGYPIEACDDPPVEGRRSPVSCVVYGRNNTPHDLIGEAALVDPSPDMLLCVGGQGAYVLAGYGQFNARSAPEVMLQTSRPDRENDR